MAGRKSASSGRTKSAGATKDERVYRSVAEVRRTFYPNATAAERPRNVKREGAITRHHNIAPVKPAGSL